jgi:hypothetical protein
MSNEQKTESPVRQAIKTEVATMVKAWTEQHGSTQLGTVLGNVPDACRATAIEVINELILAGDVSIQRFDLKWLGADTAEGDRS